MQIDAPYTPAEALDISPGLRFTMHTVCKSADIFRYWDHPYKNAAGSFEEMTLLDKFYWVYKCNKPIVLTEKGSNLENYFQNNTDIVRLPEGFEKQAAITFGAVGDLIQTEGLEHSADKLYSNISDLLFEQTISYANLESPLTEQELKKEVISDKESPTECCSREQFNILKGHKGKHFTVMHTAGNHMYDMGAEGVETTLRQFEEDDIVDLGTNRSTSEQGKAKIITRNGIRIGFVAAAYGLNGRQVQAGEEYLINVARLLPRHGERDLSILKQQIEHCKAENCDLIIASLHWGYEFEFFPRQRQIDIAHTIVEWGADLIVAHHPHVVQPVEYYRTRRDPERVAVIAYSLGSLTWAFSAPHLVLSAVLNLSIAKGRFKGEDRCYLESARVTPVFRARSHDGDSIVTRIEKLEDHEEAARNSNRAGYISEIRRYAQLVLGYAG